MFRTKSLLNVFFPFPPCVSVHRGCIRWHKYSLTILFWCCTYVLFNAGFFWTSINVLCHLSSACLLNIGEGGKKKIGPCMWKRRKNFLCASVCQPRGIFSLHFIVSSFWRSAFQRLPLLQSSLLPHYSEPLMCWAKFLNAAFSNSGEFSLVSSSCSFPFIWRVNVCVSWRTLGRENCRLCCLSSTKTKWGDLRSVFSSQFVRKSNLEGYYFDLLV